MAHHPLKFSLTSDRIITSCMKSKSAKHTVFLAFIGFCIIILLFLQKVTLLIFVQCNVYNSDK